ncbi:hypothetical protein ACN28S_04655 [Cystobacter fuscus]
MTLVDGLLDALLQPSPTRMSWSVQDWSSYFLDEAKRMRSCLMIVSK